MVVFKDMALEVEGLLYFCIQTKLNIYLLFIIEENDLQRLAPKVLNAEIYFYNNHNASCYSARSNKFVIYLCNDLVS